MYLVVDSTDDYVESVRSALQEKLNAELDWPSTTSKVNRAFNIKLKTKQQCDAVVEWLSSERVPNTRRFRIRESKTAKLKSENPELFETTSDNEKLVSNTSILLEVGLDEEPAGNPNPERSDPRENKGAFKRDPEVIAWLSKGQEGFVNYVRGKLRFGTKIINLSSRFIISSLLQMTDRIRSITR